MTPYARHANLADLEEINMSNVYVEPRPKGKPEGTAIADYVLEHAHGALVTNVAYKTQQEAIDAAKKLGYHPLVAHVRNTNKGNRDHWRSA
jgi:hypothetical protein